MTKPCKWWGHVLAILSLCLTGCAVQMDGTNIVLDSFTLDWTGSPSDLDVDLAPGAVTCDLSISGTSTVIYAGCVLYNGVQEASCLDASPTGQLWSCTATIPQDGADGDWTVRYAFATDDTNAPFFATTAQLVSDGQDTVVPVNSPNGDSDPPSMDSFVIDPDMVDPGDNVTCIVGATDSSGIAHSGCTIAASGEDDLTCIKSGGGSCVMTLSPTADAGVKWTEVNHFAVDTLGNSTIVANTRETLCVLE